LAELFASYEGKGILPSKPIVITFDDGYEDNFLTALPIMEKYNMKATVFIVPNLVNNPGYLSWQQITAMQDRQMEIGSHTMNHLGLSELNPDEQRREAIDSKAIIEQHIGRSVKFFAYPYGEFNHITSKY
jgi:peptidoglycan/xylan/chitin deacetylase (PgdA/CDA1 family)